MKSLFLKWAVLEVVAICLIVTMGLVGYATNLHGLPLFVCILLAGIGTFVTGYAGFLCWETDNLGKTAYPDIPKKKESILHHTHNIFHAMWLCMVLGMIGALTVYRQEAHSASNLTDVSTAIHSVFSSLANGLTATLMGLLCSVIIFLDHRLLDHELNKP